MPGEVPGGTGQRHTIRGFSPPPTQGRTGIIFDESGLESAGLNRKDRSVWRMMVHGSTVALGAVGRWAFATLGSPRFARPGHAPQEARWPRHDRSRDAPVRSALHPRAGLPLPVKQSPPRSSIANGSPRDESPRPPRPQGRGHPPSQNTEPTVGTASTGSGVQRRGWEGGGGQPIEIHPVEAVAIVDAPPCPAPAVDEQKQRSPHPAEEDSVGPPLSPLASRPSPSNRGHREGSSGPFPLAARLLRPPSPALAAPFRRVAPLSSGVLMLCCV